MQKTSKKSSPFRFKKCTYLLLYLYRFRESQPQGEYVIWDEKVHAHTFVLCSSASRSKKEGRLVGKWPVFNQAKTWDAPQQIAGSRKSLSFSVVQLI